MEGYLESVKFEIPGIPVGKGRPKFARVENFTRTYTPEKTANYESYVKLLFQEAAQGKTFREDAELDVRILAYYDIPKSVSKKKRGMMLEKILRPTKKPDLDNCIKIITDALNKVAYRDDAMIVDIQARKFYAEQPKVVVTIQEAKKRGEKSNGTGN